MAGIARSPGQRCRCLDREAGPNRQNTSSAPTSARGRIEDLLRTEFADVQRQVIADRRVDPDA